MPRFAAVALWVAAGALALTSTAPPAEACGMVGARAGALPTVSVERVLLVHDEDAGVEHFVREIVFGKVDRPFGFIVPTPARPGVFKVDDPPWGRLEQVFTYQAPMSLAGAGQGFGSGHGRLGGAGARVLEAKPIGSFAAYVVEATDARAMKGWLERNQFVTTRASEAWLDHYVKLGFHFVALRFDPGLHRAKVAREGHGTSAETLRISFPTPVPYYPYHEPDRDEPGPERVLAVWLATRGAPKIPVALVRQGDALSYQRPWREGVRRLPVKASSFTRIVGEQSWKAFAMPGEADWQVQVFEDQKRSRKGFGDVLLVSDEPRELTPAAIEQRRALMPILDPGLEAP